MKVCAEPGCPELTNRRHCTEHTREQRARVERSPELELAQAWYKSARWAKRRQQQLARNPYCQCPMHEGQKVKATVADHVERHMGNAHAFWNGKLMSLTKHCHDSWKQRIERQQRNDSRADTTHASH